MNNKRIAKNTFMLYLMTIAKIVLPLVLLPYLTRVLTKDAFGIVNYVKALMQYMQLFIDFGFMLSATKDIVNCCGDKEKLNRVIGDTTLARMFLAMIGFIIVIVLILFMPILRDNVIFTLLSYIPIALSCLFMDFLFRGLEQMHVITIRFIAARGIATIMTLFVVNNDNDLLWIPLLEIIGTLIAVLLVFLEIRERRLSVKFTSISVALQKLRESAVYFFSDMATSAFHALNTVMVGIFMKASQVADWSLCLQVAMGIQALYTPITGGVYPYMVKNKDIKLIKKILKICMPLVLCGVVILYFLSPWILRILGGEKYMGITPLLRSFIPLIVISFPAMLFGWPCLGAINKQRENSLTTIFTALAQCAGLFFLLSVNKFTLLNLAFLRGGTEFLMFSMRFWLCIKYKNEFCKN